MSKAATEEQMQELHRAVASALAAEFAESEPCSTCGRKRISAAILDCAAKFLRDSGIGADSGSLLDMKKSLAELSSLGLPFKTGG